jgi:hypothetical protein
MITGATRGGGGRKLANHLADVKGHNVQTILGATRGLGVTEIRAALRELDAGAAGGNTDRHAYHLHMDPGPAEVWTDDTRREAWARLEAEMGLADAPFVEVRHVTWRTLEPEDDLDRVRAVHGADAMREKDSRHQVLMAHEHRVYDLTRDDGSVIDTSNDYARREKLGRVFEHDHGFDLVSGRHNRAVAARLDGERPDVAAAIRAAGLTDGPRPQASISPRARAQADRTGVDPRAVGAAVLAAWGASDGGMAFGAALREQGLTLAMGTKAALVIDGAGGVHPLARMLGKESKIAAGDRITAADVAARLSGLDLPRHDPAAGAPAPPLPAPAAPALEPAGLPTPEKTAPAPAAAPAVESSPNRVRTISEAAKSSAPAAADGAATLSVRPYDPTRDGDWLRFLNESTQALNKRADAGPPTMKGQPDADAGRTAAAVGASFRAALEDALRQPAEAQAVVSGGPEGGSRDGSAGRAGDAQGDGPEGTGPRPIRGDPGGDRGGQPAAPPEPPGAAPGAGDVATRPGGGPPGADRREPDQDRAARGRARVSARRASVGLAAAVEARGGRLAELTRLVAAPPTVAAVQADHARAELAASRARTAAVLAAEPWPNPADRNRGRLQDLARDRVKATMDARAAAAAIAVERAAQLRGRVGIVARALALAGVQTPSMKAAVEAAREAQRVEGGAKTARLDYREDLTQADRSGAAEADRRQRQQDTWEVRADVLAARREEAGNRMVMAAAKSGDPEIQTALRQEDGLRAAREIMLRREAERLVEIRHQQLQHARQTVAATTVREPAPAMGPRR